MNWQWLLNDILKLFKWYSNERKAVGSGHVRKDRAHRFFVRVVFVLFETRRFCKVERFVFPDLLVCTLTAFPIFIAGNYASEGGIKGLYIALNSFEQLLPGYGHYLLMVMVFFFAFSTMFSYSYYGLKCTNFLFGAENAKYYNYFYLVMIVVAAMIPLGAVVAIMDLAFALMALPTMTSLLLLAPRVRRKMKEYFAN